MIGVMIGVKSAFDQSLDFPKSLDCSLLLFSASGCRFYCRFWLPFLVAIWQDESACNTMYEHFTRKGLGFISSLFTLSLSVSRKFPWQVEKSTITISYDWKHFVDGNNCGNIFGNTVFKKPDGMQ